MSLPRNKSAYMRLPIQPDDGFPQAFNLAVNNHVYLVTTSISSLTLQPYHLWKSRQFDSATQVESKETRGGGVHRITLPWSMVGQAERQLYVLPQEKLYLTLRLERADIPVEQRQVYITRPTLNTPFRLGDLVFMFERIHIARGNLITPGSFGSSIEAGVMAYGA